MGHETDRQTDRQTETGGGVCVSVIGRGVSWPQAGPGEGCYWRASAEGPASPSWLAVSKLCSTPIMSGSSLPVSLMKVV